MVLKEIVRLIRMLLLLALQVCVFNHIHLFGYATPLVYVCFLMDFPLKYSRSATLLWGFFLGLFVDIFSNTPGVSAGAMTLTALVQPILLKAITSKDLAEDAVPSRHTIGTQKYFHYILILIVLHHIAVFSLESFAFFDTIYFLISCVSSIVLTTTIVWLIENIRNKK